MLLLRFLADLSFVIVLIFGSLFVAYLITRIVLSPGEKTMDIIPEKKPISMEITYNPPHLNPVADALEYKEARIKPGMVVKEEETPVAAAPVEQPKKQASSLAASETYLICCVLTAEGGTDQDTCNYVAQALYNACEKYNWRYSPLEMLYKYKYAPPLSWYSKEAEKAYVDVFYHGVRYPEIGNATIFYAPEYCYSEYHESQILVLDHHGVRYFEERN